MIFGMRAPKHLLHNQEQARECFANLMKSDKKCEVSDDEKRSLKYLTTV